MDTDDDEPTPKPRSGDTRVRVEGADTELPAKCG
jgi:hypothetical protein